MSPWIVNSPTTGRVICEFNIAWTTWCYDADFGFWDQQRHSYKDYPLVELLMSGKPLEKK